LGIEFEYEGRGASDIPGPVAHGPESRPSVLYGRLGHASPPHWDCRHGIAGLTADDLETRLARGGDTRAEALAPLAEVLALYEGDGERIGDPDAFLRDELGIEPSDENRDLPDFLQ
jgi:hypothetical protein